MKKVFILSTLMALSSAAALANEHGKERYGWSYLAGAGLVSTPEYLGSDEQKTTFSPILGANYKFNENHEIKVGFPRTSYTYTHGNYETGLTLGYEGGRDSDTRILAGLEEIDAYVTASPFITYNIKNFAKVSAQANFDVTDEVDGFSVDLALNDKVKINRNLVLNWEVSTSYADEEFLDTHFTTNANASVGRAAFTADDAGFYKYGAKLGGTYFLDKKQLLLANIKAEQLTGDASDASITQEDTSISAFLGYVYNF